MEPDIRLSYFFFSSRRRHTRSLCDWSSDVCSSDLLLQKRSLLCLLYVICLRDESSLDRLVGSYPEADSREPGTRLLQIPRPVLRSEDGYISLPEIGRASCRERV